MDGEGSSQKAGAGEARAGRGLTTAIKGLLGLGAFAALYVMALAACKPQSSSEGLSGLSHGAMAKLQTAPADAAFPGSFQDAKGAPVTLAALKGQVVVLNLWATWCAPCVKEMPTLARLQADFQGRPVTVVALSTDSATQKDKALAFIQTHPPLGFYFDPDLKATSSITPHVAGFPTTLLFDKAGRLRAELQGDADWSSPEAQAVVAELLKS